MKYSIKNLDKEHTAKVSGRALSISTKHSIEICNFIRGRKLEKAKALLNEVINHKIAVPFKKFNKDVGHRKGKIASGRYPENACKAILKLLEGAEANAQFKGLNTANLIVSHICANKASTPWHYGRQRRRKMKRTHVEVIVEEKAEKKKVAKKEEKPKEKKVVEKKEVKEELKKVEKKEKAKVEEKKEVKPKEEKKVVEKKPVKKKEEVKVGEKK